MKELGLDLGQLISQAVNFGLLALILSLALFKPMMAKLRERAARIQEGLDDAAQAELALGNAETRANEELDRARREAREIVEQATHRGEQQRQEILAAARQEAHELMDRAAHQAERDEINLRASLRNEMIDLALAAASRLVERDLDDDKHRQLIDQFIDHAELAEF